MYDIPILSMLGILSALIAIHFIMVWSAHIRLELGDPARPGMQVQPLLPSPRTLIGSRSGCQASFAADNPGGTAPTGLPAIRPRRCSRRPFFAGPLSKPRPTTPDGQTSL